MQHRNIFNQNITSASMIRVDNSLENKPFASDFGYESVGLSSRGITRLLLSLAVIDKWHREWKWRLSRARNYTGDANP